MQRMLEKIAEAASDYRMAQRNAEFAEMHGGIDALALELDFALGEYQAAREDDRDE